MLTRVIQEPGRSRVSGVVGRNGERGGELSEPGHEKSERRSTSEEAGEPTRGTRWSKGRRRSTEPLEGTMNETLGSVVEISTKLQRIAKLAHDAPEMALTTLSHHLDLAWMREAYRRTRKREVVRRRVRDGVLLRLIGKWAEPVLKVTSSWAIETVHGVTVTV
jgi:hypothetical protein